MTTVLLVFQVLLALGIIGLVLIQRSDSDGFGMGSGSGIGVISGRAKANLLTRATAILAALFMANSLLLAIITSNNSSSSVLDKLPNAPAAVEKTVAPEESEGADKVAPAEEKSAPVETPATQAAPTEPSAPVVPRAE